MSKINSEIYQKLVEVITTSSFDLWKDPNFRTLLDFDNLESDEQDRIFNELEVISIGLLVIQAETIPEFKDFDQQLTKAFLDKMKETNLDKKFLNDWEKLIKIRLKEYREEYDLVVKKSESWKDQTTDILRFVWARVETQTFLGVTHIRKNNLQENDFLKTIIKKWLLVLDLVFSQQLGQDYGSKITSDSLN